MTNAIKGSWSVIGLLVCFFTVPGMLRKLDSQPGNDVSGHNSVRFKGLYPCHLTGSHRFSIRFSAEFVLDSHHFCLSRVKFRAKCATCKHFNYVNSVSTTPQEERIPTNPPTECIYSRTDFFTKRSGVEFNYEWKTNWTICYWEK